MTPPWGNDGMTEGRKDGKKEGGQEGKLTVADAVTATLDAFQKTVPHWQKLAVLDIFKGAVEGLRHYIETDADKSISWKNPFAQLEYDVALTEEEPPAEEPVYITPEDARALSKDILDRLPDYVEPSIMQALTRDVAVVFEEPFIEDGRRCNCHVVLPPDVDAEVKGLPEAEREAKLKELAEGFELSDLNATGTVKTEAWSQDFAFRLVFAIRPLFYYPAGRTSYGKPHAEQDRAFYPVQVGLDFTKGDPSVWPDTDREELWTTLFDCIEKLAAPFLKAGEERKPVPEPDRVSAGKAETFKVAAGLVPMHKLAARNRGGLPLFPEARRQFYALRTPLNWATSFALCYFTSPDRPGDWQEVTLADLTDRVLCLTERAAPRRGDHRTDILAEVVKLFTETVALVMPRWEKSGRVYRSRVDLRFFRVISELELSYRDTKTGRLVRAADPGLPKDAVGSLAVKGRRVYTPDGKDIKALLGDRYKLDRIAWHWTQSVAEDFLNAPALDKKGNVKRDTSGKVLRGGFNIEVAVRIFEALFLLRSERAYVAHDLLVLLATDIYKPPKQSTSAGRNTIEREAGRLYDLLGLDADPKHPDRREETVAAAIARLMEKDIGALLPTSTTTPRPPSEAEKRGGRRKSPYYRLARSPLYTPAGIMVTKEEAAVIEAEEVAEAEPEPAAKSKTAQAVLPGMEEPPALPIPSGADIRAAREATGLNLRDFAETVGHGRRFHNTWARYERGESVRTGRIPADAWQRVRDFISQHGPKTVESGAGKGDA